MLLLSYGFLFMMLTFASKILADEPGSYKNKHVYAKLLKALIDINEKRVKAMNNLYALEHNNVEKILRSDPEMLESGKDSSQENNIMVLVLKRRPMLRGSTFIQEHGGVGSEESLAIPTEIPKVSIIDYEIKPTKPEQHTEILNLPLNSEDPSVSHIDNGIVSVAYPEKENNPRVKLQLYEMDKDDKFTAIENIEDINITKEQSKLRRKNWRGSCDKNARRTCTKACRAAFKNSCKRYSCKSNIKKELKKECKSMCKAKFS